MNKLFFFILLTVTFLNGTAFSNEIHIGDFEYQRYSNNTKEIITKTGKVFFREGVLGTNTFLIYSIMLYNNDFSSHATTFLEFESNNLAIFIKSLKKYFSWEKIATTDGDVLVKDIVTIPNVAYSFDSLYDWYTTLSGFTLRFISQYKNEDKSSIKTRLGIITDVLYTSLDKTIVFPSSYGILTSAQAKQLLSLFDEEKIEDARNRDILYKYQ